MLALQVIVALAFHSSASAVPKQDFLRANMNPSANPGVDFYEYACGSFLKRNPIPASESAWGIGNLVRDELYANMRAISEKCAQKASPIGSDEQRVGDFWATAMDTDKAESLGLQPLKPEFDRIDSIRTTEDAISTGFELTRLGCDAFFSFGVGQDDKQSDVIAVELYQGGLGLPDRDFYFNPEAGTAKVRAEYVLYVQKLLELSGRTDSPAAAASVIDFETSLAKASKKLQDLRDPESNYHKLPVAEIEAKLTPNIGWGKQLDGLNLHPKTVIVGQPEFFSGLDALLAKTPIETLQNYLRFHLVKEYAPYLNHAADEIDFHFNHTVMSGQKVPLPRWKRTLTAENRAIGFILGRLFVKDYFPPAAKVRYSNLVEAIRSSFSKRIEKLDWMSPATKAKAQEKLAAVTKKVGYPAKWKDDSALTIGRASNCENMMSAARWMFQDMVSKYGKPVDYTEWGFPPQTYNAYYNPSQNEIVLPAAGFAIPGMRDSEIDEALLYGNAGAGWIGHEMTHGFDDQGRQFDKKGNLKSWWTKEDEARFNKRADLMVKQFNQYEPIKGLHINGRSSLGENIADYGGILIGLDAFKLTKAYKSGKKIAGMTPLQRYFLGYTVGWLSQERPELLRRGLLSDVHAPAKWRVIGPLSNIPDFYKAFGIKPGQPMWRAEKDRVHIW
jgi:putative endopeptidase